MQKRIFTATLGTMILLGGLVLITGCEEREGPAERAGEKVDRAVEETKDALDPSGPAEKAGRKVDRAVDDVTR